ncbi:MAG: AAA family ATPase [Chloroflexota bacterium]|nr:AAA family ATPase [Chloroflexota bacterium]
MNIKKVKRIPYGVADFKRMRRDNSYYVDKTHFIPTLEAMPYYIIFIRPRRFGKTLWLSVLQHYYDIGEEDNFEHLFGGTYIGEHPTEERNSYLVLMFNFAMVNPDVRHVHESFEEHGRVIIGDFMKRYRQFFDEQAQREIFALPSTKEQLQEIFSHAARQGLKIYLLIDEYDNFANTILTTAGERAYRDLTHGAGFFRYFFNLIKGATSGRTAGLSRLFITGVSPVTMDDVTSGFNIGRNISLDPQFNGLLGFREDQVREMVEYYHQAGTLTLGVDECMEIMKAWYDNYRFSEEAEGRVFNSDMVLYFIQTALDRDSLPKHLIDQNVRTDYGKLRHLVTVDQRLNGNFSQLKQIMETGQVVSDVVLGFPLERLLERENFVSLLFYLGLLSFDGAERGVPILRIPNLTIKQLMYGYLRDGYRDVDVFRIDVWELSRLVGGMAYAGEWQGFFDFMAVEVEKQTSVRDYLGGEKVIQGFLLAYLNVTSYFLTWSEREMGSGFADLYLEPFLARYPDMQFGYLIELKYIPRGEFSEEKMEAQIAEAKEQLEQYASDERVQDTFQDVALKKLVLVYNGWEMVHREEIRDA